ncbi:VTT domain-containing protein [Ekhidna sp.]|uniref:VTT domain-containing protein n=1 Tax=Ekhidna sp. TaxID=2608089 RepID=UPI0032EDE8F0
MAKKTQKELPDRRRFLIRNLLRGFAWLAVIVIAFIYARKNYDFTLEAVLGPVYDRPTVVYFIFLASEVIFGIIPPEFFMIWSLRSELLANYINNIIALSAISYAAGIIGFGIGAYLKNTRFYRIMKYRVFGKFEKHLNNYGGFLVVVAALTPLPFSGIAMLVGSVHYSFKKYLWFSLFRFLRFLVYGIVIWEANIL